MFMRCLYPSSKIAAMLLAACLLLSGFRPLQQHALAKSGPADSYPEKGTVVAVRVYETTEYVPITPPDSKGRTHGGEAFVHRNQVYRVETDDGFYELEGGKNPTMAVGDAVEFRVDKGTARVRVGNKEKKYRLKAKLSKSAPSSAWNILHGDEPKASAATWFLT
jgi:hypothetical protein